MLVAYLRSSRTLQATLHGPVPCQAIWALVVNGLQDTQGCGHLGFHSTSTTSLCSAQQQQLLHLRGFPLSSLHTTTEDKTPPFSKILVANRGEIAVRVMKTAKRMGIKTVAVYSEADKNAVHVRYADEAVCIGPPPSAQSYLNVDAIMDAIRQTGAQAVHPGYGFLSENASFAERLSQEGVVFVGPPVQAIAAMGDKVESKRIAKEAGVNTIPGWIGVVDGVDHALRLALDIGFPIMIKASAGGGGKGMRIVRNEDELREGWDLCVQEAQASFGDSRMLMEKYIEEPRHIEIQLIGDQHGSVLYLPERECSIQRRNQKVVEEAPSTFTTPELRKAMGEQAVRLAQAVGYYSAGTLEFLVDKHRNFYFLEMNTRLQVEHPITEYITQLDLVEQMLRVAAGGKLAMTQEQAAKVHGWAIECRMYAEDPTKNFMPSIGRLQRYIEPTGHNVRVDSGVVEGSEISMYYDPMIGKLVTYGSTRQQALETMQRALDSFVVRGVSNNLVMLRQVVSHPDFVAGNTNTAFLLNHFPQIFTSPQQPGAAAAKKLPVAPSHRPVMLAIAAFHQITREAPLWVGAQPGGEQALVLTIDGESHAALVRTASREMVPQDHLAAGGAFEIEFDGSVHQVVPAATSTPHAPYCAVLHNVLLDGAQHTYQVTAQLPRGVVIQHAGVERDILVQTPMAAQLSPIMPKPVLSSRAKSVASPMAGSIITIAVQVGDEVLLGDDLAVIEAMKMRNVLKSEIAGKVKEVKVNAGDVVKADEVIIQFE